MVGGAHGQPGHHAQQHVVVVKEPGNVCATTLLHQGVEVTALVAALVNRLVTLLVAQVRPLKH